MDLSSFGVEVREKKFEGVSDSKLDVDFNEVKKSLQLEEVERFLPWFLKYQLKSFDELIVTKEIEKILAFFEEFKPGKGLLLVGAPGSGKTTTLNLLGDHFKFEILELNASDARNKNSIDEIVGTAIKQKSLFGSEKMILIDEVDGVSGTKDRGGAAQLSKLVKASKYPIVFTANDKDSDKLKPVKKVCVVIDFENHSSDLLLGIAKRIFEGEGIEYDEGELSEFVLDRATFDIRGFINDLQASVFDLKFVGSGNLEVRDYKKKIEGVLTSIFYSFPEDSYTSNFDTEVSIDDMFLYLEENLPNVYSKKALMNSFNELSKADVFRGRIRKWQYWRFLVYINFYLTYGVSSFKDKPERLKSFKRNDRILKKWIYGNKVGGLGSRTRIQRNKGEDEKFIEKLAKRYGRSALRVRKEDLKYFAFMYSNNNEFREMIDSDEELGVDENVRKGLLEI